MQLVSEGGLDLADDMCATGRHAKRYCALPDGTVLEYSHERLIGEQ